MLDVWLVPVLATLFVALVVFYAAVRITSGSGERTEGKTVLDKEVEEPKTTAGWNVYDKP